MSPTIRANYEDEHAIKGETFKVDNIPDYCPCCHQGIEPIRRFGWLEDKILYAIFQCPKKACRALFIGLYYVTIGLGPDILDPPFKYKGCVPWKFKKKVFQKEIMKTSPKFFVIYNQAKEAEDRGLKEICGAGYRRALEFLIKDYLIKKRVRKSNEIKETRLGACIKNYIDSPNIKDCAKRAAWLGNDETHYIRIWKDKDLEDLKDLIELTANWIRDEHLTKRIKKEMPEKTPKIGK
jgi:hypothetical protein